MDRARVCVIVMAAAGSIWWSSGIQAAAQPYDGELASYLRIEERELARET